MGCSFSREDAENQIPEACSIQTMDTYYINNAVYWMCDQISQMLNRGLLSFYLTYDYVRCRVPELDDYPDWKTEVNNEVKEILRNKGYTLEKWKEETKFIIVRLSIPPKYEEKDPMLS